MTRATNDVVCVRTESKGDELLAVTEAPRQSVDLIYMRFTRAVHREDGESQKPATDRGLPSGQSVVDDTK